MSIKPNFAAMTTTELRAYVLEHRGDGQAFQVYIDRLHDENPSSRTYNSTDNVSEAIADYLQSKGQWNA